MTEEPPFDRAEVVRLAKVALTAAIGNRNGEATSAVQAIADLHEDAITIAMMAWCDTALAHVPGWQTSPGNGVIMQFREEKAGGIQGPDEVPEGVRWAGEVLIARARMDEAAFIEAISSCESDREFSANISHLLTLIATNLRPVYEAAKQVRASRQR